MGQANSSESISDLFTDMYASATGKSQPGSVPNVALLTFEEFEKQLEEMNEISRAFLDRDDRRLVFVLKRGTYDSMFWKGTVVIYAACVNSSNQVQSYNRITLKHFIQLYHTLRTQVQQIEGSSQQAEVAKMIFNKLEECCVCMDRKPDLILPCTHSYCSSCIREWSEYADSCPVCRESLDDMDDSWVLPEIPKESEVSAEIQKTLQDLASKRAK